jgi:NADH:ubiquinone oxidoreductase subunit 2 (subunit N)
LLSLYFSEIFFFVFILYLFCFIWFFFFKLGFLSTLNFYSYDNKITTINKNIKNINFNVILRLNFLIIFIYLLYFYLFKSFSIVNWWNHFKFNNISIYLVLLVLFLNIIYLFILNNSHFNSESYKYDFFFALLNLSIFLVILLFTNTLFSFFFLLEVNSVLIFFKFLMSKTWYKDNNKSSLNLKQSNNSKTFINMLFFQFWTAFFSSVLFVYTIIFLLFTFGSTEWAFLNLINSISFEFFQSSNFNFFLVLVLIFAFFLKLGMTPVHLYKIEIYKGINFISIFFYTTYYFFIFFLYFLLLILLNLNSFNNFIMYILSMLILLGSLFVISLLFDVSYVKAFLAYSSIVNSVSFFIIILSIIY